mgnify:CR=1 FL=1|tara:strand:+ start:319 stop:1272 length:954 start_codon:yes stop_codon:yes gene_type:complete
MANILLRSPYYVNLSRATGLSAKLELTIKGNTEDISTLRYTIIKNTPTNSVTFEISQLCRDYLDIAYAGSYISAVVNISGAVTWYDAVDAGGSSVGLPVNFTHKGFDGYWDYVNSSSNKNFCTSGICLMQDNTTIYVPENTAGYVPTLSSGAIVYETFNTSSTSIAVGSPAQTITITRTQCSRYSPIKVTFVNKYGALQDVYFEMRSTKSISTKVEKYNNSNISTAGTYSGQSHQFKTLNKKGRERITINTGYMDDGMNEPMKQLMLSEQVWATIDGNIHPVDVATSSMTFKTGKNDKLVQYTLDLEYAHESIDRVR